METRMQSAYADYMSYQKEYEEKYGCKTQMSFHDFCVATGWFRFG